MDHETACDKPCEGCGGYPCRYLDIACDIKHHVCAHCRGLTTGTCGACKTEQVVIPGNRLADHPTAKGFCFGSFCPPV